MTVAPVEDVGEDGRYRFDVSDKIESESCKNPSVLGKSALQTIAQPLWAVHQGVDRVSRSNSIALFIQFSRFVVAPCDRFFKLIQFLPNLRYLCLESLDPLSGSEFKAIGERCPKLRVLLVRHCYL